MPRGAGAPLRAAFVLPGLHRVNRGAEVALEAIARELARSQGCDVTLLGSGAARPDEPYRFVHVGCVDRSRFERWPKFPPLRSEYAYEELTFVPGLFHAYDPREYDVTLTCSYPFCNWLLRRGSWRAARPAHVYVTQNGDWPCHAAHREYRFFHCDGLVCTNPDYFDRNRARWPCALIPNGVDPSVFAPGPADRAAFGLPDGPPVVLMVSALIPSKRVLDAIPCVAAIPDVHLVVAGDGPLRDPVDRLGAQLLGARFQRLSVDRARMPDLYRCADAFLHMSLDEPSANAYIEALATDLPIVTHDRRVTRWTFEEQAVLVDATRPADVTAAIRRAIDVRRSGPRGPRRALAQRRFAWTAIAGEYAAFLREVVDAHRTRKRG